MVLRVKNTARYFVRIWFHYEQFKVLSVKNLVYSLQHEKLIQSLTFLLHEKRLSFSDPEEEAKKSESTFCNFHCTMILFGFKCNRHNPSVSSPGREGLDVRAGVYSKEMDFYL